MYKAQHTSVMAQRNMNWKRGRGLRSPGLPCAALVSNSPRVNEARTYRPRTGAVLNLGIRRQYGRHKMYSCVLENEWDRLMQRGSESREERCSAPASIPRVPLLFINMKTRLASVPEADQARRDAWDQVVFASPKTSLCLLTGTPPPPAEVGRLRAGHLSVAGDAGCAFGEGMAGWLVFSGVYYWRYIYLLLGPYSD